ncbi:MULTISPECIES: hypothetical protein [Halomonadaceae]|uniref:Secreted protein n=2 Tax=Vreelandella TaxID=3137766 RepID=A0A7Z0RZU2_9GAMM|nr:MULTISPECIES: hypothetical protein [Halomonas]NYS79620.1 hypothetical protein [Halomonas glaciei]
MIKKAALLLTAPFLMVFSDFALSDNYNYYHIANRAGSFASSPAASCRNYVESDSELHSETYYSPATCLYYRHGTYGYITNTIRHESASSCPDNVVHGCGNANYIAYLENNPLALPTKTNEECQSENGDSYNTQDASVSNYLSSGGSVKTHSGACSVSMGGGVLTCAGSGDSLDCSVPIQSVSTGDYGIYGNNITGGFSVIV